MPSSLISYRSTVYFPTASSFQAIPVPGVEGMRAWPFSTRKGFSSTGAAHSVYSSQCRVGVTAIIQPGGSIRDAEVIAAADKHGMAMVLTGTRQFRH